MQQHNMGALHVICSIAALVTWVVTRTTKSGCEIVVGPRRETEGGKGGEGVSEDGVTDLHAFTQLVDG